MASPIPTESDLGSAAAGQRSSFADGKFHGRGLGAKLLVLLVVALVIGLPINHLFGYLLLVVTAIIVFTGAVSFSWKRWALAAATLAAVFIAQIIAAPPGIDEGHNVFVYDFETPKPGLEVSLPAEVFQFMAREFDAAYPAEARCTHRDNGCWRTNKFPTRPYAFSADGIYDRAPMSRRVTAIDFDDPTWLRLGFVNELTYNWYNHTSDVHRGQRDQRFWVVLHRWRQTMPWYVTYRFPASFIGSDLCWRGNVLWEESPDHFSILKHEKMACRTLTANDAGQRIFGVAIRPDSLAMKLDPTARVRVLQLAAPCLTMIAVIVLLGLLVRVRVRDTLLPLSLIGLALAVVFVSDASFLGGMRYHDGGDDGLVYEGKGRLMVQALVQGDIREALRGTVDVFYFTPGLRYFRMFERLIFGETNFGYLSLLLVLPILVLSLFQRFLPARWALALMLIFMLTPIGILFGSNFFLLVKFASRGYADPAAFITFIGGLLMILGRASGQEIARFSQCLGAGLLFALAVFLRPNLVPLVGVVLAGAGIAALRRARSWCLVGLCLGFLPVSLMAIHNWYFGGVFVLFSSNSAHPLVYLMPPWAYAQALGEVLQLNFAGDHAMRAWAQIGHWLSGPRELMVMVTVHAAAVLILIKVGLDQRFDGWLRVIAWATIAQHAISLCFLIIPRYALVTWLLTLLVTVVWFRQEGSVALRRRFPGWTAAVIGHPASRMLRRGLDLWQRRIGLDERASGRL